MDDSFPIIGKIKIPNYTAVIQQVSDSKGTKINFEKTQDIIEPAKNALAVLGITLGQGDPGFKNCSNTTKYWRNTVRLAKRYWEILSEF